MLKNKKLFYKCCNIFGFLCYSVIVAIPQGEKNMKIIHLNTKTKNYIKRLLELQKIAIENDYTKLLKQINQKLFTINQAWRKKMLQINQIDYTMKNYKMIVNATCYKF
jgi:hypothetical protein